MKQGSELRRHHRLPVMVPATARPPRGAPGLIVLAIGVAACAYEPPPIPLVADQSGGAALAGEWSGWFERDAGDRSGNLYFRLALDSDTARGDLLMFPPPPVIPSLPDEFGPTSPAPRVLTVQFVRAAQDRVSGVLDPYLDPECGCRLTTTFEGRIDGWRVSGTFTTLYLESGREDHGIWEARRERGPADPDALAAEPGLRGPSQSEMRAEGERLFGELGCARCHGPDLGGRIGPELNEVTRHRDFAWIFHMILHPDSMVRNDPAARRLYQDLGIEMEDTGASPWEALVLYEYLKAAVNRAGASNRPR